MHNCLKLHTPFSLHLTYYEKTYIEIVPELEVTQSWAQELRKREIKKVWIWWMRKISNIVHIHWNIFNSHINTFNSHNIFIVKVISVLLQLHTVEKTAKSQPSYEYIRVQSLWPHIWSHMLKVCFSFSLLHKQILSCTLKQELSYHVRFNTVFECSLENFRHN